MQLQVTPFAQTTPGAHEPEVSVQVVPGAHLQVGGGGRGRSGSVSTALAAKVSAVTATVAVHSKPQQRTNSMQPSLAVDSGEALVHVSAIAATNESAVNHLPASGG